MTISVECAASIRKHARVRHLIRSPDIHTDTLLKLDTPGSPVFSAISLF